MQFNIIQIIKKNYLSSWKLSREELPNMWATNKEGKCRSKSFFENSNTYTYMLFLVQCNFSLLPQPVRTVFLCLHVFMYLLNTQNGIKHRCLVWRPICQCSHLLAPTQTKRSDCLCDALPQGWIFSEICLGFVFFFVAPGWLRASIMHFIMTG